MTIAEVRRRLALATNARARLDAAVAELLPTGKVVRVSAIDDTAVVVGEANAFGELLTVTRCGDYRPVPLDKLLADNPQLDREPAIDHKYAEAVR